MTKNYQDLDPETEFWKIKPPYPLKYANISNGERLGYLDTGATQSSDTCFLFHG